MIRIRTSLTAVAVSITLAIPATPLRLPAIHAVHAASFSSGQHRHASASPSWLAQVRYIYHGLSVQAPQGKKQRATKRMPLYLQYGLETAQSQKGSIAFHDDTTIAINQKTQAVLQSAHVTYLKRGEIAQYLAPGTDHQIKTASARASAHGTTFDVEVSGNQTTFVVLHGALQVQTTAGSVVVKSNQLAVATPNQMPAAPKTVNALLWFDWTVQIPKPDLGEDLALDANGGSIVAYSSQREGNGGRWHADRMIDGLLSQGWESAGGKVKKQWVKIGFRGDSLYRVTGVVVDPAATHGDSPSADLKDFEIRVSATGTKDSSFTRVFTGTCQQANKLQRFVLPAPVTARYVELFMRNNYGNSRHLAVAEVEVVGSLGH